MDNLIWRFPSAIRIDSMPSLDFVRDIEYFDGPILSEFKDSNDHPYVYYWLDCDLASATSRWMVVKTSAEVIEAYITFKIDLRSLLLNNLEGFVYTLDIGTHTAVIHKIIKSDLSDDYLPNEGCMHMEMDK